MSDKDTIYRQDAIKTIKDADVFVAYHEKDPIDEAVDEAIRATKRSVIYDIGILPSASPDLSTFSDKLWKIAYERGRKEGRKKGEWIDNTFCSECGWVHEVEPGFIGSVEQFNFCPNCGADMRGEQNDTD